MATRNTGESEPLKSRIRLAANITRFIAASAAVCAITAMNGAAHARNGNFSFEANMSQSNTGVANLPFARGRIFQSLDEYLAHLERQGAIDLPWWREIRPGVYEHVVRISPGRQREVLTRQQLMERFGFTR